MSDQSELIKKELHKYLIKMHKNEATVAETLTNLMSTVEGLRFAYRRHFIYMLDGLIVDILPNKGVTSEDKAYSEGYTELAEEVNYGLNLAMDIVKGEDRNEKDN
jgi:hypothetical protein